MNVPLIIEGGAGKVCQNAPALQKFFPTGSERASRRYSQASRNGGRTAIVRPNPKARSLQRGGAARRKPRHSDALTEAEIRRDPRWVAGLARKQTNAIHSWPRLISCPGLTGRIGILIRTIVPIPAFALRKLHRQIIMLYERRQNSLDNVVVYILR